MKTFYECFISLVEKVLKSDSYTEPKAVWAWLEKITLYYNNMSVLQYL